MPVNHFEDAKCYLSTHISMGRTASSYFSVGGGGLAVKTGLQEYDWQLLESVELVINVGFLNMSEWEMLRNLVMTWLGSKLPILKYFKDEKILSGGVDKGGFCTAKPSGSVLLESASGDSKESR